LLQAGGKTGRDVAHAGHVFVEGAEGSLKVTRSLGDSPFHKGDAVSCVPDVSLTQAALGTSFVIVASDGVWDHMDNATAVNLVGACLADRQGTAASIAASACDAVLARVEEMTALVETADCPPTSTSVSSASVDNKSVPRKKASVDDKSVVVVVFRESSQN
jgi:serine/threonine protein phosphatase PrpC